MPDIASNGSVGGVNSALYNAVPFTTRRLERYPPNGLLAKLGPSPPMTGLLYFATYELLSLYGLPSCIPLTYNFVLPLCLASAM